MHPRRRDRAIRGRRSRTAAVSCVFVAVLALVPAAGGTPPAHAAGTCPAAASVAVFVENLSADTSLQLAVDGELRDPASTCEGAGAPSYATTLTCAGSGTVRCGVLPGLRPGAWINRVSVTVSGSSPQVQAAESVVVAGSGISNVLRWTIYPQTFTVAATDEATLRAALDAATAYTDQNPGPALVVFSPAAFPGTAAPQTIDLSQHLCPDDSRHAALCWTGSRIVVDGLDRRAERGGVVLSVADRAVPLLRVYGADNVLRGVTLQGTSAASPTVQADTLAIAGTGARRNRLERCLVRGPSRGDAVSVESGAGQPDGDGAADNVIADCELTGARDRGLKVTTGGHATLRASCVHDNRDGGVLSTLGGHVTALQNVIQHNVPGNSQNGLSAGAPADAGERSTVVTDGNVIRFSGARGVTVIDNADAAFANDYVADNQFAGAKVESTRPGSAPVALFEGVALACNHNEGVTGICQPTGTSGALPCVTDADCCGTDAGCCVTDPGCAAPVRCAPPAPQGYGAVLAQCDGCQPPALDLGSAAAPGRNAFTQNVNWYPGALGINLAHGIAGLVLGASGNQWERCGPDATCDTAAILAGDVRVVAGASVDLGTPGAARAGTPIPQAVSVGRPRAGDLVRVFGKNFNAIDGAACARTTAPAAPCSTENPAVAQQNRAQRWGNRVQLAIAGAIVPIDIDVVTPTMVAFRMPVDCFAPATLEVTKRDQNGIRVGGTIPFCDPGGCAGEAANTPCDDADVCTQGDLCSASGACVPGPRLDCGGQCMRCDPVAGCMPRTAGSRCDDGNACTAGDACRGDDDVCEPGPPADCDDHDACTVDTCDPTVGCRHTPIEDFPAVHCRLAAMAQAITDTLGDTREARLLGRALGRIAQAADAAELARDGGDARKASLRLGRARTRLRALLTALPRHRALPVALLAQLTSSGGAALAEIERLRSAA